MSVTPLDCVLRGKTDLNMHDAVVPQHSRLALYHIATYITDPDERLPDISHLSCS